MPILKKTQQHKHLLDTHIWIWLIEGDLRLSPAFRKVVDLCQDLDNVLVSAISVLEVGMLVKKKRISIETDCLDWVEMALNQPGVRLVPISPRIAIQSTRLPGDLHADPADRILAATAHEENATLVTCDQKLLDYGKDVFISVHDPRVTK